MIVSPDPDLADYLLGQHGMPIYLTPGDCPVADLVDAVVLHGSSVAEIDQAIVAPSRWPVTGLLPFRYRSYEGEENKAVDGPCSLHFAFVETYMPVFIAGMSSKILPKYSASCIIPMNAPDAAEVRYIVESLIAWNRQPHLDDAAAHQPPGDQLDARSPVPEHSGTIAQEAGATL
jgi:hypothetical protein